MDTITETLKQTAHPLACPEARTFADLFEEWKLYGDGKSHGVAPRVFEFTDYLGDIPRVLRTPKGQPVGQPPKATMLVGPYCGVEARGPGGRSFAPALAVRCNDATFRAITERTIGIADDRMTFKIIQWNESEALVTCDHGVIIGGVWVAIIDPATVPFIEDTDED